MDRGARSAGMRHSHNEAKKVADMLSELLVEQIHTTPKKRSDELRQRVC